MRGYWTLVLLAVLFGLLFSSLLTTHMIQPETDGLYSGGSTWADLAFHLSLISSFTHRGIAATIAEHPLFTGMNLTYPFVSDLISAFIIKAGASLQTALIVPSLLLIILTTVAMYMLAGAITKRRLGAFFVPFLFFFNGSVFGLYYFWQDMQKSGQGLWSFLFKMNKEYAHLADYNIRFSNIIADYILPQRAIILGFVLGILAIYFFWLYWDSGDKKKLLWAGIATVFLPLVHTHTFLTIGMIGGFLFFTQLAVNRFRNFRHVFFDWLYFFIPVFAIAIPQFLWISPHDRSGFIRFQVGWMKGNDSFWWFWLKNLGIYIPLFIAGFICAPRKLKTFYMAFLCIFVLTNLVIFQPHDYDNMKFMLYWFLMSLVLVAVLIDRVAERWPRLWIVLVVPVLIITISTGVLSVFRETYVHWQMFSNEDIALAQYVERATPVDALFLTSDKHNHPIPDLAGRRVVMGYRGWLWTHGIKYAQQEKDVLTMYEGGSDVLAFLRQYHVSYILFESNKIRDFRMNQEFLDRNFKLVYQSSNYRLYEVAYEI